MSGVGHEANPLISVIMAAHNRSRFIRAAIESVLVQGYTPLEIIIVDDGSIDDTQEVVRALIDETAAPITCVYQPNQGLPVAHNHGLRLAHGEVMEPDRRYPDAGGGAFGEQPRKAHT